MSFSEFISRRAAIGAIAALAAIAAPALVQAQDLEKVKLGALRFTSHSAGFIALEKGYFAEEGLDVELEFFQAAQPIAVATASGDVDFGIAGVTGGAMNLAQKNAIRIVAGVLHEKKGVDGMMILASNKAYDAGLDSVAEIKGHSVAMTQVGSTFHYMTARIGEAEGFSLDEVKMLPLQKVGAMIAALKSGQADVMIMVPHIAKALVNSGDAKDLGRLYDYAEYQISTMITSVGNIENNRDKVERFLRAYQKGIADFNRVMLADDADPAEKEELTKIIHKYVYADRPYEKAKGPIQAGAMWLNEGAALNVADVEKQMTWAKEQGLVQGDLTMDQLVDTSFVENYTP